MVYILKNISKPTLAIPIAVLMLSNAAWAVDCTDGTILAVFVTTT